MERITRLLAGLLRITARLLPPARRQWAEAIQAEAGQVPAGWRQLHWLADGLWLVAMEAKVTRKIVYGLGLGVVAAAAAWAIWLSWRTVPIADPESVTDRVRVLVGMSALLVLPWAGHRSGLFGPAGSGVTPRLVRVAGCVAICCLGASLVRLDGNAGKGGVLGFGHFSWPQETAGLALLGTAAVMPHVIRTLKPRAGAAAGAHGSVRGRHPRRDFAPVTGVSRYPRDRHDSWPGRGHDHLRSADVQSRSRPGRLPNGVGTRVPGHCRLGRFCGRMAAAGHRGLARTAGAASPPGTARWRDR